MSTTDNENTVSGNSIAGGLTVWTPRSSVYYFAPEQLLMDDSINLRPFSGGSDGIEELAASIKALGQQEAVTVRFDSEMRPHIITGRRRTLAISLINSGIEDELKKLLVACSEGTTTMESAQIDDKSAWLMAWSENKDREQMTAMDVALNLQQARTLLGFGGKKGTKQLATALGVSPAYVTTHEKLLGLSEEQKKEASEKGWTADYAIEVATTAPEVREKVIEVAQEIAEKEAGKKGGKKGATVAQDAKSTPKPSPKTPKPSAKHLRAAKKKVEGAETGKKKERTKADIVDFVESELRSPLFGYSNGPVQKWVTYFLSWIKGEGTDRGLVERFKVMTEGVDMGLQDSPPTTINTVTGKEEPKKTAKVKAPKPVKTKKPTAKKAAKKKAKSKSKK